MNYESGMKKLEKSVEKSRNYSRHNSYFKIHNSARGRALVVGSVAYDVIFDIHGKINDSIVIENGKLGRQNLMFTAKAKQQHYGGTGGNIAYGLGLLGAKPILFSAAGRDFKPHFHEHLKSHGVDVKVSVDESNWTAAFYGMSDDSREQIGVWQPNAHNNLETLNIADSLDKKSFKDVSVAIFSGQPTVALRHMKSVRKILGKKVTTIFDPGQVVQFYDKKMLSEGLKLSDIFIANDVEIKRACDTLGCSVEEILKYGPRVVIETKGDLGSVLYQSGKKILILAVKPGQIVETTGAGDAYRAGLMYGILNGLDLSESCRIGSILGARNVETVGGQMYQITPKDLKV